jgi:hypothetical protein
MIEVRYSVVGRATGYGLDDQGIGVRVPVMSRIFSSPRRPDGLWGPASFPSNGHRRLIPPGVKRPGLETDHSAHEKCGSIHSLPHTSSWRGV